MNAELEYECERGHKISSVRPVDRCPAYRHGRHCDGEIHAVGEGSRTENHRLTEQRRMVSA